MAKALNLTQVITDGGMYVPDEIFDLRKNVKLPGFHTFSAINDRLPRHKSIRKGKLHNLDWNQVFSSPNRDQLFKQVDQYARDHLNQFWGRYGLSMKLGVEHKLERSSFFASHFAKAHYYQKAVSGIEVDVCGMGSVNRLYMSECDGE